MHWFKRNIGDHHKKAGRLSMIQHGAYTLLMDSCYDREQFPTLDEAIEWTWASSEDEVEAVKFVLNRFFTLEDDIYVQARIKEELEKYHSTAKTNKLIAIEREAKRREKKHEACKKDNEACTSSERPANEPPPNQELRTNNQELRTKNYKTRTKDITTLSSKPDDVKKVLDYLNSKRASNYKPTIANSKLINARLKEGFNAADLIRVINNKITEWGKDKKMAKYIRPATLFNAEKFSQYVGEPALELDDDYDITICPWEQDNKIIEGELSRA